MIDGKGKRAVIINNIKSGTIEQAIFILKPPASEKNVGAGSVIIAEAQEIINSYIGMMDGQRGVRRQNNFKEKIGLISAILAGVTAIGIICMLALL